MSSDLVSVIVPVYNKEYFLRQAIESILLQTYHVFEVLLIDDGSTDKSGEICRLYAMQDQRVKYIYKENGGVSSARNLGIKNAHGKYIVFVDADDSIATTHIEYLLSGLKEANCEVAALSMATIRPMSRDLLHQKTVVGRHAVEELCLLRFPSSLWAYMYSADLINNALLQDNIHFFEDFLFNYEVLLTCDQIALLNCNTYYYNINESSINRSKLTWKRMSCLKIHDYLKRRNAVAAIYTQQYTFFKAHCYISLLLAAANTDNWEDYAVQLKEAVNDLLHESSRSRFVPLSYKLLIFVSNINLHFAVGICRLRNIFKTMLLRKKCSDEKAN